MPRETEIYARVTNTRYPWITQAVSDKHLFWDCYWCKAKKHLVSNISDFFNNDAIRVTRQEFILEHKTCRDMSIQLEMF